MAFGYTPPPGNTGRSLKDALDALMAQDFRQQEAPPAPGSIQSGFPDLGYVAPKPQDMLDVSSLQSPSRMGTPGAAERGVPPVATARNISPGGADREPFGGIPDFYNPGEDVVRGEPIEFPPPSPFAGVTRENAARGLAGLQAAQANQFSPFGEMELTRLANRDPRMVAPGSNELWAGKLREMQGNRQQADALQRRALEGISGAISSTHPAVQFQAEQEARRRAMPATITAQGQFRAAQEAANARRDVGEAQLEGRSITAQHNTLDTVMNAIRAIRAKSGGLTSDDAVQLRALENLYDLLSEPLTGATFDEATEGFEE